MKLNKDQKQKIVLGSMLMAGIIYITDDFLLTPLALERAAISGEITADEPKFREMRGQINRGRDLGLKSPEALKVTNQINSMIPDGSPIAWCPPRIVDFFKPYGIERVSARMTNETPDRKSVV